MQSWLKYMIGFLFLTVALTAVILILGPSDYHPEKGQENSVGQLSSDHVDSVNK